jgi:hypothetical protein
VMPVPAPRFPAPAHMPSPCWPWLPAWVFPLCLATAQLLLEGWLCLVVGGWRPVGTRAAGPGHHCFHPLLPPNPPTHPPNAACAQLGTAGSGTSSRALSTPTSSTRCAPQPPPPPVHLLAPPPLAAARGGQHYLL